MNKRAAKEAADSFQGTIGDLRAMIAASSRAGISTINPALTKAQAVDIFAAALYGLADDELPAMWRPDPYSRRGAMKGTGDRLIVQYIHRECA